jgi:hypothetical protein
VLYQFFSFSNSWRIRILFYFSGRGHFSNIISIRSAHENIRNDFVNTFLYSFCFCVYCFECFIDFIDDHCKNEFLKNIHDETSKGDKAGSWTRCKYSLSFFVSDWSWQLEVFHQGFFFEGGETQILTRDKTLPKRMV